MLFPPWTGRDVRRGSSTLNSVLSGSRSGGSLFAVAGATGSRLRTSESFDPKHKNIDHEHPALPNDHEDHNFYYEHP